MKTAITAGLLFAVLFAAAPLQAKQAAIQQTEARALSGNITAQITLADTFRTKQDIIAEKVVNAVIAPLPGVFMRERQHSHTAPLSFTSR